MNTTREERETRWAAEDKANDDYGSAMKRARDDYLTWEERATWIEDGAEWTRQQREAEESQKAAEAKADADYWDAIRLLP